jgi:hypothetical protein
VTVLVLMKGTDADATIDALVCSGQQVEVDDEGPYWKLRSAGDIVVDMQAVEEELGRPITVATWLVSLSTYVGFVDKSDTQFAVRHNITPPGA